MPASDAKVELAVARDIEAALTASCAFTYRGKDAEFGANAWSAVRSLINDAVIVIKVSSNTSDVVELSSSTDPELEYAKSVRKIIVPFNNHASDFLSELDLLKDSIRRWLLKLKIFEEFCGYSNKVSKV
ncbi:MAG: hypothetical protein EOO21_03215 [Comamonadaceae bacterium]|nr:MAG: hypothetical protein EOO21_03215 [Comamonadaceae bacterium]